jgi:succinoglycan biosynthesis protein ExoW
MTATMTTIAIVIPYYQKQQGILRRALDSILQQQIGPDIRLRVIVVDDGSPSPVEPETEGLSFPENIVLEVVHQPNGGCARARNGGLNKIGADADYVAFLDSDDYWKPGHIAKAVSALSQGYDFYFTDHDRVGFHESFFSYLNFPHTLSKDALTQISGSVWEVQKDAFFSYFLRMLTAHISSVVFLWKCAPHIRFNNSMRTAGEDYLYMLQLISQTHKVCFSTDIMITCADGLNIYYGTYSWDDEGHLRRLMGDIVTICEITKAFQPSGSNLVFIKRKRRMLRHQFAYFCTRWFIKYRIKWSFELRQIAKSDPSLYLWLPLNIIYVSVMSPLGLYDPTKAPGEFNRKYLVS